MAGGQVIRITLAHNRLDIHSGCEFIAMVDLFVVLETYPIPASTTAVKLLLHRFQVHYVLQCLHHSICTRDRYANGTLYTYKKTQSTHKGNYRRLHFEKFLREISYHLSLLDVTLQCFYCVECSSTNYTHPVCYSSVVKILIMANKFFFTSITSFHTRGPENPRSYFYHLLL